MGELRRKELWEVGVGGIVVGGRLSLITESVPSPSADASWPACAGSTSTCLAADCGIAQRLTVELGWDTLGVMRQLCRVLSV